MFITHFYNSLYFIKTTITLANSIPPTPNYIIIMIANTLKLVYRYTERALTPSTFTQMLLSNINKQSLAVLQFAKFRKLCTIYICMTAIFMYSIMITFNDAAINYWIIKRKWVCLKSLRFWDWDKNIILKIKWFGSI